MVGLVVVDLWGFPGASTQRSPCRLRTVDALWFESFGILG